MAPKTTAEWYDDGLSMLDSGFFDSAIQCFDEVLSAEPQNAKAWALKGTALIGMSNHDEALACFDNALDLDPENAQARRGQTLCLTELARGEAPTRPQPQTEEITEGAEAPTPLPKEPVYKLYSVADGLVVDAVHGMAADEEEAWFVYGQYGGATRLTLRNQRLLTYTTDDGLISDAVRCVLLNGNDVWLGTDRGLSRFDREAEEWTGYSRESDLKAEVINGLAIQGEMLWLGTDSGLVVLDMATGRSVLCPGGPEPQQVDSVLVDGRLVWCGASRKGGGLSVFDSRAGTFRRLDVAVPVHGLQLFPRRANQRLWLATKDGTAIVNRATYEVEQIPLSDVVVTGIAVGVKGLLISTVRGLTIVAVAEEDPKRQVTVERSNIGWGQHISAVCASRTTEWIAIQGQGVVCLAYPS
jgi:hypothetical protein